MFIGKILQNRNPEVKPGRLTGKSRFFAGRTLAARLDLPAQVS
jgi:hypothetical protein